MRSLMTQQVNHSAVRQRVWSATIAEAETVTIRLPSRHAAWQFATLLSR
jgi:hypothetical protein